MAVSIKDIQKLREMTGAGLADCKKALEESNGEIEPAIEIIRKKGQAVAAKRSDREASEGCVVVKVDGNFAAIIALKCETDFVANNADFVKLTQEILDAAVAARCKTLDEVKALKFGDATVQDAVVARSGITGEKMELDGYNVVEGDTIATYDHQGKHTLCTMVAFSKGFEDATVGKNIAMQVASASPVAIDQSSVPQEVKDSELRVAIEKTKEEQIAKAVEAAIRKAGVNPAHVDSEDHIESNMAKGWITPEQAAMVREIKEKVAAEKAANLPEQMIQNIAQGRLKKFFKESCLLEQEYIWDKNLSVAQYLQSVDKELTVTAFKRFTLRAE